MDQLPATGGHDLPGAALHDRFSGREQQGEENRPGGTCDHYGSRLTYSEFECLTGKRRNEADALIASTALVHNLVVVTRSVRDFDGTGVVVVDPWHG